MEKVKVKIDVQGDRRKGTCWAKTVSKIDFEKDGGYMFEGEFLQNGEKLLEIGTVILQIETQGSWKNNRQIAYLGVVNEAGDIIWQDKEGVQWTKYKVTLAQQCDEILKIKNEKI